MMRMGFSGHKKGVNHERPTVIGCQACKDEAGFWSTLLLQAMVDYEHYGHLHLYILWWLGSREPCCMEEAMSRVSLYLNSMSEAFHSMCSDPHQTGD